MVAQLGGRARVSAGDPKRVFYNDCPPDVAERAAASLVPQRKAAFTQELRAAAWERVASTYVACERDNAIPPAVQERMAILADTVSRIDAGHAPFLSRPHEVTAIIRRRSRSSLQGGA